MSTPRVSAAAAHDAAIRELIALGFGRNKIARRLGLGKGVVAGWIWRHRLIPEHRRRARRGGRVNITVSNLQWADAKRTERRP